MILRTLDVLGTVAYVATVPFTYEKFTYSYGKMMVYNTKVLETESQSVYYDRQQISWIPRGRNDLVKSMRGDWIFMLDADLEFDPDVLVRMLKVMDKYQALVLTGLYVHKKYPHFPVLYSHNPRRRVYEIIAKWDGNPEIFQVDAAGGGCLLIKKFVFNMIWDKLGEDPFSPIKILGEDFSFFDRLRRIGVGVYCAPQIKFSHINNIPISYDNTIFSPSYISKPYEREGK